MNLAGIIRASTVTAIGLADYLDALSDDDRLAQTLALEGDEQALLFDLVAGARKLSLEDLAPKTSQPLVGVLHAGKNSLPLFTRFAKVFSVPDVATPQPERWGFNLNPALVALTVGPGYFVASEQGQEVLIDYTRQPPRRLLDGPRILPNDSRLSRFVYNGTKDLLRGVSKHVSIGRASRGTRQLDNWFVLCRTS